MIYDLVEKRSDLDLCWFFVFDFLNSMHISSPRLGQVIGLVDPSLIPDIRDDDRLPPTNRLFRQHRNRT